MSNYRRYVSFRRYVVTVTLFLNVSSKTAYEKSFFIINPTACNNYRTVLNYY